MPTLEELAAAEEATEETTEEATEESSEETQEAEAEESSEDTSDEGGAEEESSEEDPDAAFFDELAEKTGHSGWRDKYASKDEALRAIGHLVSAFGERNEELAQARALREKLGDDEYHRLLAGRKESEKPDAKPEDDLPASWDEMLMAQQLLENDAGTTQEKDRARKKIAAFQRKLFDLVRSPQGDFKALEEKIEELRQSSTETAEQAAVREWDARYGKDVYGDGNGLTPLGRKVDELMRTHPVIQKLPNEVDRRNMALELARSSQPKAKPHRKVRKEGKHQRATGRETEDLRSTKEQMDDAWKNGMSEDEFFKTFVMKSPE